MSDRFTAPFLAAALLVGCTTAQITATQQAVADANTLAGDIQADIAQYQANGTIPATALTQATAQLAAFQTDIAALSKGTSTVTTVLADATQVEQTLAPFIPEIAALVSAAGPRGATAKVATASASKIAADQAALKADAGVR